jgi:hypothetical protein
MINHSLQNPVCETPFLRFTVAAEYINRHLFRQLASEA